MSATAPTPGLPVPTRVTGPPPALLSGGVLLVLAIQLLAGHPAWTGLALAAVGVLALAATLPAAAVALAFLGLLLAPDFETTRTLGLRLPWSHGLTLSNFLLPALWALLLIGGLGRPGIWPSLQWPPALRRTLGFLAWASLSLAPLFFAHALDRQEWVTVLGHLLKLGVYVVVAAGLVSCFVVPAAHLPVVAGRGRQPAPPVGRAVVREGRWVCLILLLGGLGVNAGLALAQSRGTLPVFSPLAQAGDQLSARATGTFYDANMFGSLLAFGLGPTLSLLALRDLALSTRLGLGALAALFSTALLATGSRAALLSFAVVLVVFALRGARRSLLCGVVCALALGAVAPRAAWEHVGGAWDTVVGRPAALHPDDGTLRRLRSMQDGWRQFLAHPLLGQGFGHTLYIGVPSLAGRGFAGEVVPFHRADPGFSGAQNTVLTVLDELGPVGLVLFGSIWTVTLRELRPTGNPAVTAVREGLRAGLWALLAASLTVELFYNARLLALLLVVLATWSEPPVSTTPASSRCVCSRKPKTDNRQPLESIHAT